MQEQGLLVRILNNTLEFSAMQDLCEYRVLNGKERNVFETDTLCEQCNNKHV